MTLESYIIRHWKAILYGTGKLYYMTQESFVIMQRDTGKLYYMTQESFVIMQRDTGKLYYTTLESYCYYAT